MKINSISAVNYSNTAKSIKSNLENFSGIKNVMHGAGNTMKALMLASMMGMAAVGMSSCKQPTDPTPIEEPVIEEPTVEEPVVEEPVIEDPAVSGVKSTGIYKIFNDFGFEVTTESVEAIDNQYQPKTGDILSLSYTDISVASPYVYSYTLDKDRSTDDTLIYTGSYVKINSKRPFQEDYTTVTIEVNKEEKLIDICPKPNINLHYIFDLNDDNTVTYTIFSQNGELIEPMHLNKDEKALEGEDHKFKFSDVKVKLAE